MPHSEIDLHCHSLASDGELSPVDLVQRAHERGVKVLSLTDHDTLEGLADAQAASLPLGIELIPGIEFSCQWNGYTIHILGLNLDLSQESIWQAQTHQERVRRERSHEICERLQRKGLPATLELATRNAHSGVPGRPHFADALIELGAVKNHQEAFKKYLGAGKTGDVKAGWPSLEQVVNWIIAAQGRAVIAHPRKYNMSLTKLRALIEDFIRAGGEGLEVIVSGQKQGEVGLLTDLCRRYQLAASLGSDFHSPRFPWTELGHIASLPSGLKPVWYDWNLDWVGASEVS